jgi:nucleotide-binding universal stress UspA family protein
MKTINVCLDGSEHSNTATEYALYLAEKTESRITALHVLDSRWLEGPLFADLSGSIGAMPYTAEWSVFSELMEKKGAAILDAFSANAEGRGAPSGVELLHGHPVKVLLDQAKNCDLMLFGQHGESAEKNEWLPGSTADRLIRGAPCPVLVTPLNFSPITSILTAHDGTDAAHAALKKAAQLSNALSARLIVLTVIDKTTRDQAKAIMETAQEIVQAQNAKATFLIKEGDPETVIPAQVEAHGCDLLVMGIEKHSWLAEHLLGTLSLHLVHHSRQPVLLVR